MVLLETEDWLLVELVLDVADVDAEDAVADVVVVVDVEVVEVVAVLDQENVPTPKAGEP